jgi:hypothetical protein
MKHNIVLMVSALYTNYGIYDAEQRKKQTLETIKSIKQYIPNPIILMMENSTVAIQADESPELTEIIDQVDYFFDNSDDADIQYFHNNIANYDIGKNSMETIGTTKVLKHIANDPELRTLINDSNRFFKISGRYLITEDFDFNKFANAQTDGKYVFKQAAKAWIPEADTGVTTLLQTRFFSFSPDLYAATIELYQTILSNMLGTFNRQKYIDLEHSMSKFIPKDKLVEVDLLGITGNIAPNGVKVID